MILPPEAIPPRIAAVVWAVMRGARTYREVSKACGTVSHTGPYHAISDAREMGLIGFEDRKARTLHPTLEVVAFTPSDH